ncbi:MAG: lipopolysaccharide kinase InaA family protein [Pseudomonadales bacterium]
MSSLTSNDDEWRQRFRDYGWPSFDALWQLKADTVEPENVRRGGWSSVVRMEAQDGTAYYLKRQENHDFRDASTGYRRTPTVVREWRTAAAFSTLGIGVATAVCLGVDKTDASRGLLVTEALDDHAALSDVLQASPTSADRRSLWQQLADQIRRMHEHHYRHNCLYAQHILVRQESSGRWDIRFIDLEKASQVRNVNRATIGDLSQLDRHTDDMSLGDRLWLWDCYFEGVPLSSRRQILKTLAKRSAARGVR